jgi:hypothetical protein
MTFIVSESEPMTFVLGTIAMLMALVLAWRGYRFHTREDRARKTALKRRRGG